MELKRLISSLSSLNPSSDSVDEFILLCRRIALVYIRRKAAYGCIRFDLLSISLDDLAIDCIADLFQRDGEGNLIQIRTFFESISIETTSEQDLLTHLRRLMFARVNQSLFRIYNEVDPSLGKILRNMKIAIQALHNFHIIERFGETCITPSMCEALEHLPEVDPIVLEEKLRLDAKGRDNVPAMMSKLSFYLREQTEHSRIIPIMTVAIIFRSIYCDVPAIQEVHIEEQFVAHDTLAIINEVCTRVMNELEPRYVGKKKMDAPTLKKYFDVIKKNLYQVIILQDGEKYSFYDNLQAQMPELTKDNYQKNHRSKLEYFAKLAHKRAIKELKNHF
jgi:hypothetical protein